MPLVLILSFLISTCLQASVFSGSDQQEVGESFTVLTYKKQNLFDIGRQYHVGINEMRAANPGLKDHVPAKTLVVIPSLYPLPPKEYRQGIVINLAGPRLYYFSEDDTVFTAPVAVGRPGWRTPELKTHVVRKVAGPAWHPPESIKKYHLQKTGESLPDMVSPGSHNPLGPYAIYLHAPAILIHGTNTEKSIGRYATSGCIRMFNKDIETLYRLVRPKDNVTIINVPMNDEGTILTDIEMETSHALS